MFTPLSCSCHVFFSSFFFCLFFGRNFITSDHDKRYLSARQLLTIMADTAVPCKWFKRRLVTSLLWTIKTPSRPYQGEIVWHFKSCLTLRNQHLSEAKYWLVFNFSHFSLFWYVGQIFPSCLLGFFHATVCQVTLIALHKRPDSVKCVQNNTWPLILYWQIFKHQIGKLPIMTSRLSSF